MYTRFKTDPTKKKNKRKEKQKIISKIKVRIVVLVENVMRTNQKIHPNTQWKRSPTQSHFLRIECVVDFFIHIDSETTSRMHKQNKSKRRKKK